jgi:hypothetical protein
MLPCKLISQAQNMEPLEKYIHLSYTVNPRHVYTTRGVTADLDAVI